MEEVMKAGKHVGRKWSLALVSLIMAIAVNCGNTLNLPITISGTGSVNLGGVVLGLSAGETVTLSNNSSDSVMITGSGTGNDAFQFGAQLTAGESYYVSIISQPLTKTCVVGGNTGVAGTTDIMTVQVNCSASVPMYTIGGTVTNLLGSGLVLRNNGTDMVTINGNGAFAFSTPLVDAAAYSVIVSPHPSNPSQTCAVTGGTGNVAGADVTNIAVDCGPIIPFSVSGVVNGLVSPDSITLKNNGVDDKILIGAGGFTFTPQPDLSSYNVSFAVSGSANCSISNNVGTLGGSNVTNVAVNCSYGATYTVGGTVTGLATGAMVVLKNGSEFLPITANGAFTFTVSLPDLSAYSVIVNNQPTSPVQNCLVTGGQNGTGGGNIAAANVNSIAVNCTTATYSVNVNVTGLTGGDSITLQNNGADNRVATALAPNFSFAVQSDLSVYNVSILTPTAGKTCTISGGIGAINHSNATVTVTCAASPTYTIGGVITGLVSGTTGVTLNNGFESATFTTNGSFVFPTAKPNLTPYTVTVTSQPSNPGEVCALTNASGTINGSNVTTVVVTCSVNTYTVGGTINWNGTPGTVTLRYNGTNDLAITFPTTNFTFPGGYNDGSSYFVSVFSTLGGISCTPGANSGIISGGNVTNVSVSCSSTTTYAVGVNVSGFGGGSSLMLANNATDLLSVSANGISNFSTPLASGAVYNLSIVQQPTGPNQNCTFGGAASGTVSGATTIGVTCTTSTYTIGGAITGLANGEVITLQNNGGNNTNITGNGSGYDSFTFSAQISDGNAYNVTVLTPPAGKTCTPGANNGNVSGGPVSSVVVGCVGGGTPMYTIGGAVTGLAAGNTVTLRNNGADDLVVSVNGAFTFATALADASPYSISVFSNPTTPNQTCTVISGGAGTVSGANVLSVNIACTTIQYTVGGSVSGMNPGDSITIVNNGANPVTLNANGGFTFASQNDGSSYNVTVQTMPATTTCTVGAGTGTLAGTNIINVTVTCSAAGTFSIGGTLSGLIGTSVQLSLNGVLSTVTLNADGPYSFPKTLSLGTIYSVIVSIPPTAPSQSCSVTNPGGTIAGNVSNININCVTNTYTISGSVAGLATSTPGPVETIPVLFGSTAVLVNGDLPTFTSAPINDGTIVQMQIVDSPYGKNCSFTNPLPDATPPAGKWATLTLNGANITGVTINCTAQTMAAVSITVSGMTGNGLQVVNYISVPGSNSFTDTRTINANGTQSFMSQPEASDYTVVVTSMPSGEVCFTSGASSGTMATPATAVNVAINCVVTGGGASTPLSFGITAPAEAVAVASTRQYEITGLNPLTNYTFQLTSLTGDVNLYVFDSNTFSNLLCSSVNTGLATESCSWSGQSAYYIKVVNYSGSASNFNIRVFDPSIVCGNNITEIGEQCDDGNASSFDGCSSTCQTETSYTIGGFVQGISGLGIGESITLKNGAQNLVINGTGANPLYFQFATPAYDGNSYFIQQISATVTGKICLLDINTQTGTISGSNITSIIVNCNPIQNYTISGTVLNLASGKTATVTLNGTENIPLTGGAGAPPKPFAFVTTVPDGSPFSVTIAPGGGVTCTPLSVSGTVSGGNVSGVGFECGTGIVADAYEPDDTIGTSKPINPDGVKQYRSFNVALNADIISLAVDTTTLAYTIETWDETGTACAVIDTRVSILNGAGVEIAQDEDGGIGTCSKLTYKFPSTGTYYIKVYDSMSNTAYYNVSVKRSYMINRETFDVGLGNYTTNVLGGVTPPPYNVWWHASPGISTPYNYELNNANWVPFYSDGNYAVADSWSPNAAFLDTELVSPVLNCSMVTSVFLSFDLVYKDLSANDFFYTDVRIDGGAWQNVATYTASQLYIHPDLDISVLASGKSNVQIRFRYIGNNDYYVLLDNISVVGN